MQHKDQEARRQARLHRLGSNTPACAECGETDDSALSRSQSGELRCANCRKRAAAASVRRERNTHRSCVLTGDQDPACLEKHHLAGRAHHPFTVDVNANAHARLSDMQRDHPPKQTNGDSALEAVGRFLLGLADFLSLLIATLRSFGELLIARAAQAVSVEQEMAR